MSEAAVVGTVTTPTEPTPPANVPEPTGNPPVDPGKPTEPAPAEPPLLGDEPAVGDPKPADANEPKPPAGAPEKYEFKDADKYDAAVIGVFAEAAKAVNLPQEAAQALLEKVAPALEKRIQDQTASVHKQWLDASLTDKDFGGDKFKENMGVATVALKQFASPEYVKFLQESGLNKHPETIRAWFKVGQAISEDKKLVGGKSPDAPPPAEVFYPTMTKK